MRELTLQSKAHLKDGCIFLDTCGSTIHMSSKKQGIMIELFYIHIYS
jgi:hypothetical protein